MRFLKQKLQLIFILALAVSCQPNDDFPALQNPIPLKPALLNGTWTVKSVTQFDREASDNGFPVEIQKRDITTLFPFTQYKVTFNLQADGRPGAFEVVPGTSPNFLTLNKGVWSLDDYVFATKITLTSPSDVNASSFRIKVLNSNSIKLQVVRNDAADNTEYSYYEYEFTK